MNQYKYGFCGKCVREKIILIYIQIRFDCDAANFIALLSAKCAVFVVIVAVVVISPLGLFLFF